MSELVVRFYGRFVFAESSEHPGQLTVIAVDPDKATRAPNRPPIDPHHVFMSVRERHLAFLRDDRPVIGLRPTYRMMDGGLASDAGHNLWDIAGYQVGIPGDGSFKWGPNQGAGVADLNQLGKRPLNQKYLTTLDPNDVTTAIARVSAGTAHAFQMTNVEVLYEFVAFDGKSVTTTFAGMLADMVEVRMPFPIDHYLAVTLKRPQGSSTVTLTDTPPKGLKSAPSNEVVLTFSNLCAESHSGPDVEFAAFYEILDEPPAIERPIPQKASVQTMRPFGDCFLNAKVSY